MDQNERFRLQRFPIEDVNGGGQTIAYKTQRAGVVQRDLMRLVESGNLCDDQTGVDIDHLHAAAMSDVEPPRLRIHREVIPVAGAADGPGFLDEEWVAGKFGCRGDGSLLRGKREASEQAKKRRSPHGTRLLDAFDALRARIVRIIRWPLLRAASCGL